MRRPVLELLVDREPAAPAAHTARYLCAWALPRAAAAGASRPTARFATSTRAPGFSAAVDDDIPLAVWVAAAEAEGAVSSLPDRVTVVSDGDVPGAVRVPEPGVDASAWRAHPPFVRRRWRARLGIDDAVVVCTSAEARLGPWLMPTALAVAAAACVDRRWLLTALALNTPTVTDAESAAAAGVADGVHVLVAPPEQQREVARNLAGDLPVASRLGHAGRRHVEQRHDISRPSEHLARRLRLWPPPGQVVASRVLDRLDELALPRPLAAVHPWRHGGLGEPCPPTLEQIGGP